MVKTACITNTNGYRLLWKHIVAGWQQGMTSGHSGGSLVMAKVVYTVPINSRRETIVLWLFSQSAMLPNLNKKSNPIFSGSKLVEK